MACSLANAGDHAEKSETSGATVSGAASPAAQASAILNLKAISMGVVRRDGGAGWVAGPSFSSVGRLWNFGGSLHLGHQVVVPLALDLEVRGGAKLGRLDQVVRDVGVDAGLQELVHRRSR